MCIHVGMVCTHVPYSILIPEPSGWCQVLVPACDSGVRDWLSRHFRCDEVGCCPGHTDSLSALSPRKCCVLMRCDKGAEDFKGADVNFSCC